MNKIELRMKIIDLLTRIDRYDILNFVFTFIKRLFEKECAGNQPTENSARYSSINMLCQIQREDVQNYLNIIIKDVYEEVCPNE